MIKAGVIGYPIEHSLSPVIHNYWLKKYSITGSYVKIKIAPENLQEEIRRLKREGYAGFNVTIPHKETILKFVTAKDQYVTSIGAANTITFRSDIVEATNTDWYGFLKPVNHFELDRNKDALLIGAGGAARAIINACYALPIRKIIIANRTKGKAEKLKKEFADGGKDISVIDFADIEKHLPHTSLLINSSSLGMKAEPPLKINLSGLPKSSVVYDIIYNPLETELLKAAKENGNQIIGGLEMLIHQAMPGFEIWFGVKPEADDALRKLLYTELAKR